MKIISGNLKTETNTLHKDFRVNTPGKTPKGKLEIFSNPVHFKPINLLLTDYSGFSSQ
jgi:hypothetical protein